MVFGGEKHIVSPRFSLKPNLGIVPGLRFSLQSFETGYVLLAAKRATPPRGRRRTPLPQANCLSGFGACRNAKRPGKCGKTGWSLLEHLRGNYFIRLQIVHLLYKNHEPCKNRFEVVNKKVNIIYTLICCFNILSNLSSPSLASCYTSSMHFSDQTRCSLFAGL